jgi:hypothetical protein
MISGVIVIVEIVVIQVKIHILTSILDKKDNWCYDLSIIPKRDILKVIYDNGMVRNIEFDGVFY